MLVWEGLQGCQGTAGAHAADDTASGAGQRVVHRCLLSTIACLQECSRMTLWRRPETPSKQDRVVWTQDFVRYLRHDGSSIKTHGFQTQESAGTSPILQLYRGVCRHTLISLQFQDEISYMAIARRHELQLYKLLERIRERKNLRYCQPPMADLMPGSRGKYHHVRPYISSFIICNSAILPS